MESDALRSAYTLDLNESGNYTPLGAPGQWPAAPTAPGNANTPLQQQLP